MISVIIPTIEGREHWLERCLNAYQRTSIHADYEIVIERDHPTCTLGWIAGAERARGDFLQFSSDDLEPHFGWWESALAVVVERELPCADLHDRLGAFSHCGDGTEWLVEGSPSAIARVPFLPRSLYGELGPVMPNHYMSDYWIAWRAAQLGWRTVVVHGYLFTHHHAMEGRLETLEADARDYHRLTGEVA